MQIEWWTLALQAINFIVLVWLLHRFLYRPVKAVIEKRQKFAERAFADAEQEKRAAADAQKRIEDERAQMAEERRALLSKVHEEMRAERDQTLATARQDADRMIDEARKAIDQERRQAVHDMRDEMARLAVDLAAKLLRETGAETLNDVALERVLAQIEALPADEKAEMAADLAHEESRLIVATAAPLGPTDRDLWTKRLVGALAGDGTRIAFETDAGLIGGAELRLPHTIVRFTWADLLAKAEKELSGDDAAA